MAGKSNISLSSQEWRPVLLGTALFAAGMMVRGLFIAQKSPLLIRSPLSTLLPQLSTDEKADLPYPPDALPGARDVNSPYGSLRVYEFGPEDGRKVLLVHGISTPCLALGGVAHGLVDQGYRVILFDLLGRGYSDTPGDLPHDIRLFTTQILLALASSPLSWTGRESNKFSMIGYSLGGGICNAFFSYFPELVDSLVLIAPSGLIRDRHISYRSRVIYSAGVIPEPILIRAVKNRLKTPLYPPKKQPDENESLGATTAIQAETKFETNSRAVLSKTHPNITIESAVAHQVDNHEGFVTAFMSSIRYGPIQRQHEYWERIGQRLSSQNREENGKGKVLIICGERDPIIDKEELQEDAEKALQGNVEFRFISAGHEVPITRSGEVVKCVTDFWDRD